ncbi:hypothetical protein [Bradyrhizobium japonicum]|uniref:hypothetical protein n=1 Tax=Bradyrhizobium japonicum TaxID=375 RepID=UPI00130E66FD
MSAGLSDPCSLKQRFTFRPGGLAGQFFKLSGLLGHSFVKRAGLLHSAAHGAPLNLLKTNPQLLQPD